MGQNLSFIAASLACSLLSSAAMQRSTLHHKRPLKEGPPDARAVSVEWNYLIIALTNRFMTCIHWHMAGRHFVFVQFGEDKHSRKFITVCLKDTYLSTGA